MDNIRKTRVLHVLKSSVYSGAENVAITIIKYLSIDFDFLYLATEGSVRESLEQEHVPFLLLNKINRRNLERIIRIWEPDVVHAHDFSASVLCSAVAGRFRLISHLHYDPPWVKYWNGRTLLYTLCGKKISRVLTVSEKVFRNMIFAKSFEDKWIMIGNPIDGKRIRKMARQSFPKGQDAKCDLIYVGRFVEQKNPQRFIRLVAALKQHGWSDIQCWMLGTGHLLEECKIMIEHLNLQHNISIKGFQENPYIYISRARVMCITSRWEGFGLVALEANILGVPVLSTRNAGCSEIFGDEAEELCDTDEQFVQKLETLLKNSEAYKIWQERMKQRVRQYDNMNKYMTELLYIYRNEGSSDNSCIRM